jgi:prepilin-type N-terminal cleavage/methylation domain-containing protein
MMRRPIRAAIRGLTLIELMVVISLVAVLIAISAPSFKRFIDTQRLRSVNAALITDLQFARGEAASRNRPVAIKFDKSGGALTCYVILTGDHELCDCKNTPGSNVCGGIAQKEIKTVQIDRSLSITLGIPDGQSINTIRFSPATGRLEVLVLDDFVPPTAPFLIDVSNPAVGAFRNSIESTGRPSSCSPAASISGVTACAP